MAGKKWVWIAGFKVLKNSKEWKALVAWLKKHRPKPSKRQVAVRYAKASLAYAGKMVYTEGPQRSELFNRKPGDFAGAHADCSQFVSALMHWAGITTVNDTDATGTLLEKGKAVKDPAIGRICIFGPGPGVHAAMFVGRSGGVWQLVEFGEQSAPDEISLPNAIAYFRSRSEPGVRFRDFFE